MERTYGLKIGDGFIRDLMNPKPEEIDLAAIDGRLRSARRFTNNPAALTVWQHVHLVRMIAEKLQDIRSAFQTEVLVWCRYHDDHEGIIGDIPGPLKFLIGQHTGVLDSIEHGLDQAICKARGISFPSYPVKQHVHAYDKMAETIEWVYVLGEPLADWNWPIHRTLDEPWIREALARVRQI